MAARTAAIRNSEQKIRCQIDGMNVDACLGFGVIELPMQLSSPLVQGYMDKE
jgi:hypothetical protein